MNHPQINGIKLPSEQACDEAAAPARRTHRRSGVILPLIVFLFLGIRNNPVDATEKVAGSSAGILRVAPQTLVIDHPCAPDDSSRLSSAVTGVGSDARPLVIESPFHYRGAADNGTGGILDLDWSVLDDLQSHENIVLRGFAIGLNRKVDLDLHRVHVFDDRSVFVAGTPGGDRSIPPPDVTLLGGTVIGETGSQVFFGLARGGVNGFIRLNAEVYTLSSGPPSGLASGADTRVGMMRLAKNPVGESTPWECEVRNNDEVPGSTRSPASAGAPAPPGLRVCNLAIEADYEYFQLMGEDETTATTYVAQLIAAVSGIFERDFHTALRLSSVRVWTTPDDPYTECGLRGLEEFQLYAQSHLFDKDWNLAYRFSGCGGGGAAFINALCGSGEKRGRHPYAVSRIQGYFPFPPTPGPGNWDLYAVAHELGHMFGTDHTHCYVPPIDKCFTRPNSCWQGETVCTRGTIMSYCNRCGGIGNIDLRFHPRVIAQVAPFIARSCLRTAESGFFVYNDGAAPLAVDSIRSSQPWLTVSHSGFLVAPGESLLVSVLPDWDRIPVDGMTAQLAVYSGAEPTAAVDVTVNRQRPFSAFSLSPLSGCWPLTVTLTDESSNGATDWSWSFGDGKHSNARNVSHTYTRPGEYRVSMTAANACGAHTALDTLRVVVTEPFLCCPPTSYTMTLGDSLVRVQDLHPCALVPDVSFDTIQFMVDPDSDTAGIARIEENRYLSIVPPRGWFGRADLSVLAVTPDGCRCRSIVRVIVNDPPSIRLLSPGPGTYPVNQTLILSWEDSDRDNNARITFFRSQRPDCSGGVAINPNDIFENSDGRGDTLIWNLAGVPDGTYYIRAVISDLFASAQDCSEARVMVDQTPPVTRAELTCMQQSQNGWCNGDVTVKLVATDNFTGIRETRYRFNGAVTQVYNGPLTVTLEGTTSLAFRSVDIAGNTEPTQTLTPPIRIDREPPRVVSITSDNKLFIPGDNTSATPAFTIQLLDHGVGTEARSIRVRIDPGSAKGPELFSGDSAGIHYDPDSRRLMITVTDDLLPGKQTLTTTVTDALGNRTTAQTVFQVSNRLALTDVVNFPNPFGRKTAFTFAITQDATVSIRIFDLDGNVIREINGVEVSAGYNEIPWDGLTIEGQTIANGAYVYEIIARNESGRARQLEKLAVLR